MFIGQSQTLQVQRGVLPGAPGNLLVLPGRSRAAESAQPSSLQVGYSTVMQVLPFRGDVPVFHSRAIIRVAKTPLISLSGSKLLNACNVLS